MGILREIKLLVPGVGMLVFALLSDHISPGPAGITCACGWTVCLAKFTKKNLLGFKKKKILIVIIIKVFC